MAWLESHQELKEHPKLKRLCKLLKVPPPTGIGHLHLLWWWVLSYRMDGVLTDLNDSEIAEAAMYKGDPKRFVNALVEARFIDRADGVLTVHDWLDFCGEVVRKRLQRLAEKRRKAAEIGGHCPSTNPTKPKPTLPDTSKPNQPNQPNQPKQTEPGKIDTYSLLVSCGVSGSKAGWMKEKYSFSQVTRVVSYCQDKYPKNSSRAIEKALSEGWEV